MEQENEIARDDSPRSANELMQEYAALVTAEAIENREKCKIVPYVGCFTNWSNGPGRTSWKPCANCAVRKCWRRISTSISR